MVFSSLIFLFSFFPATLILYYLVPLKFKNIVLLLSSLLFYAWGEPVYVILMIFSIVFNYFMGRDIDFNRSNKRAMKYSLLTAVIVNLAILGFFKYYGFVIDTINAILPVTIPYKSLALPIGISFYTFQTLSYIIDVYYDRIPVQKNIIRFGVYVSMFPQLIAGPIVRYIDIEEDLDNRKITINQFYSGMTHFVIGLGKKVLIANNIGSLFTTISSMDMGNISVLSAWLGALAYTFQIYFDFSGYSDMAIGLGKMFGFTFMKNFDYPYISTSITEFWRRWHISLSTWFKEYVYIPLGGNRVSTLKHIRNILIVWLLTGLWHGASWNFVFWGLYYGIILLFEKYVLVKILDKIPVAVRRIYTIVLVIIGWVFFFSPDLSYAWSYLKLMFGIGAHGFVDRTGFYYLYTNLILFIASILGSTPYIHNLFQVTMLRRKHPRLKTATAIYTGVFILCIAYLVTATYNPFLYFRF